MEFIEMVDLIKSTFNNVHNGSVLPEDAEKNISDTLSVMFTPEDQEVMMTFDVMFVDPTQSGEPFVVRTYPQVYDGAPIYEFCARMASHASRDELVSRWHDIKTWCVEINLGCVKRSLYQNEGNYNISPEALTAMMILDILNVVKSDSVVNTIYDAYCDSYITDTEFDIRRDGTDVGALSKLYLIPILTACFIKDWIIMKNPVNIASSLKVSVAGAENMIPPEYINAYECGLAQLIKNNGNTDLMKTPSEKFQKVSERMLWASRYYRDYTKRKNYLKDEMIAFAMRTCSPNLRVIYLSFLDSMGMQLHERYTGAVVEGTIADHQDLFTDKKVMFTYSVDRNPKMRSAFDLCAERDMRVMESFKTRLGLLRSRPMLPSEKEIDLIFVDVDRMSDQYERKQVLNNIYDLIDRINAFEEFYSDDQSVMRKWGPVVNNMLDRLNEARIEVLNKRSFKDNYKVFINYPEGYEG